MFLKRAFIAVSLILLPAAAIAEDNQPDAKKDSFFLAPVTNPAIVATYPLTEDFLSKMEAVQTDMAEKSMTLTAADTGNDGSIDGLVDAISKNQSIVAILKKHALEPKDYVVGYMALQASLAAAASLDDKDAIFDESTTVSKENLEFGQKNADRIRVFLEK
ncbi:hypothetical protein [Bartonella sp. LJL80]